VFRNPAGARAEVSSVARELILGEPASQFLVGGQRGVDTWAALAAMALEVPFTVILPLPVDQFAQDWSEDDRAALDQTLAHANAVRIVGGYGAAAYRERNRLLATEADLLVAVWTGVLGGGTAETLELARAAARRIREVLLAPADSAYLAQGRGI
jgi:hypothetical protein